MFLKCHTNRHKSKNKTAEILGEAPINGAKYIKKMTVKLVAGLLAVKSAEIRLECDSVRSAYVNRR